MNDPQPTPAQQHEQPPRFRRFDEALYWLADHGWRLVTARHRHSGSHRRLVHPAYTRALIVPQPHGGWEEYQQMQLAAHLRKLDRLYRRHEGDRA